MRTYIARCIRSAGKYLPLALMLWGFGFSFFVLGFLIGDVRLP